MQVYDFAVKSLALTSFSKYCCQLFYIGGTVVNTLIINIHEYES